MNQTELLALWARVEVHLKSVLPEVRSLMAAKFAAMVKIEPNDALSQTGMFNGADIAENYIEHNEFGLALEHMAHMIEEAGLPISAQTRADLEIAAQEMGMGALVTQLPRTTNS